VSNVKWRVTMLGGSSGVEALRGAWYIIAVTVWGQSFKKRLNSL
jgi:hypothetical protein